MTTNLPATKPTFPEQLPFDEAMNILAGLAGKPLVWTDEDYQAIYGFESEQIQLFREDPEFIKQTHLSVQELKESGGSLKQKSRLQLENYLDVAIPQMMAEHTDIVPAKDKISILQFLAKLSGMVDESKTKQAEQEASKTSSPSFTLILQTPQAVEPKLVNNQDIING